MITIEATVPCHAAPSWAVWERKLIKVMEQSVYSFLEKYTREDGTLIWGTELETRDGADDFYESFYNWPLLYLLGGGDHLLSLGIRQWEAVTKQLSDMDMLHREYEKGYDWFHQGESCLYFYFLCMADPTNSKMIDRARRFAGFYLNEDPDAPNYDPDLKLIRAPHNGSLGPRWGLMDGDPVYSWSSVMRHYGLPYEDVPGITSYDDLKDHELARRMGQALYDRMGRGDVATNLLATSLVTNAYLITGDDKYRKWVLEYVDAWRERAQRNGGLLPDNVGLSGEVGEYNKGKWYGGNYGWTWPHGFYNIGQAAIVAASNAYLLSQDSDYLDLARTQIDQVLEQGAVRDVRHLEMSLDHHWTGILESLDEKKGTFVVPYRYGDNGWFDYQPMSLMFPTAVWNLSMASSDWECIERIRQASRYDWNLVISFRTKEDSGHEQPWLRFLAGENPSYPELILSASYAQVCRRLESIRQDNEDLMKVSIHHWQNLNPVVTEALIQLTLGAPQIMYNGGLLMCRVRYFDLDRHRPGLPEDVAALVEKLEDKRTVLRLVNLSPLRSHDVVIQPGAFGEHRFNSVRYTVGTNECPRPIGNNSATEVQTEQVTTVVGDDTLHVHLPPAREIVLDLETERYVNQPSNELPWNR
ncbi:MAG: hypothetical protein QF713_05945 [Dehalococcoidales bacterium]|nr:hypothetical protein [Dehalococcoidales bacterium]